LPPIFAISFIFLSLTYLTDVEYRISQRIPPIKANLTPELQRVLCEFIASYHQALLESDAPHLLQFYAPTVKYYHLGNISRQIVFEEKQAYFWRWQYLEQTLLETPEVLLTNVSNEFHVNYVFKFRVDKPFGTFPSTMAGKGRQLWRLRKTADSFIILEENQQIFYRHDN
jgi:hypothetical protein